MNEVVYFGEVCDKWLSDAPIKLSFEQFSSLWDSFNCDLALNGYSYISDSVLHLDFLREVIAPRIKTHRKRLLSGEGDVNIICVCEMYKK